MWTSFLQFAIFSVFLFPNTLIKFTFCWLRTEPSSLHRLSKFHIANIKRNTSCGDDRWGHSRKEPQRVLHPNDFLKVYPLTLISKYSQTTADLLWVWILTVSRFMNPKIPPATSQANKMTRQAKNCRHTHTHTDTMRLIDFYKFKLCKVHLKILSSNRWFFHSWLLCFPPRRVLLFSRY